jgi:hypothetical protein
MQMPPGSANASQPRGDVDAVAVYIVAIGDHVAKVNPDAKGDAPALGRIGIAVGHCPLYLDSAPHRIYHAGKFDQHAVAGGFNDAALMFGNARIGQFAAMRLKTLKRPLLVHPHQARVSSHIGSKDRSWMARGVAGAGGTRRHSSVAWRAVGEYPCLGHPRPPFHPRLSQRLCNRFQSAYPIEPDLPPLAAPPQRLFRGRFS